MKYLVKCQKDITYDWCLCFESDSLQECKDYIKEETKYTSYSFKISKRK